MIPSFARHHTAKHLLNCAQILCFSMSWNFKSTRMLVSERLQPVHLNVSWIWEVRLCPTYFAFDFSFNFVGKELRVSMIITLWLWSEAASTFGRFTLKEILLKIKFSKLQQQYPNAENLIKQLLYSRLLDMRLVKANSALRASLAIYHLISNARSWNNC